MRDQLAKRCDGAKGDGRVLGDVMREKVPMMSASFVPHGSGVRGSPVTTPRAVHERIAHLTVRAKNIWTSAFTLKIVELCHSAS
jgi:hypothetical protein